MASCPVLPPYYPAPWPELPVGLPLELPRLPHASTTAASTLLLLPNLRSHDPLWRCLVCPGGWLPHATKSASSPAPCPSNTN